MALNDYRLRCPIGDGPDGRSYLAVNQDDEEVVIHHLSRIRDDDHRRGELSARRNVVGLVGRGCRVVIEDALRAEIPFLVVATGGKTLGDRLAEGTLSPQATLSVAAQLARALAIGHSLGVVHGELGPSTVAIDDNGGATLDFIAPRTGTQRAVTQADVACRPVDGEPLTPASDARSLGALMRVMLAGQATDAKTERIISLLTAGEPQARPTLEDAADALASQLGDTMEPARTLMFESVTEPGLIPAARSRDNPPPRERVGRFVLTRLLGRGASGVVCEGQDLGTGERVAVKLLHQNRLDEKGRLRFLKESRILSELAHPSIAKLLHAGMDDDDVPYMAVEHVDGRTFGRLLRDEAPLEPLRAARLITAAARGLAAAHAAGIVHRDIKPDNLMVYEDESGAESVKLIDFGIARHVDESASLELTREGAVLGTPLYMAPEQATGEVLDARADVYALGATLFHAVCGRPPHPGSGAADVLSQLLRNDAPRVSEVSPGVPAALAAVIDHALSKPRDLRVADAGELANALDAALGNAAGRIEQHPTQPREPERVLKYEFEWKLPATPAQLWPYVSQTDRVNRAIGLDAIAYQTVKEEGDVRRYAKLQVAGLKLAWREHPYEWIEGRRLGILREFSQGPFLWFHSVVDLHDNGDGSTRLVHEISVEPRGVLGRAAAAVEVGRKGKKGLDRVYKRIGALVAGELSRGDSRRRPDAYEPQQRLGADAERVLAEGERVLVEERGVSAAAVAALGDFLRDAPAQEIARIRPRALARRLSIGEDEMLTACLHAADLGLLEILWDILCPACRVPAQLHETLRALREHGRCEACDLDFELDLAGSVELVFRVSASLRVAETGFYCIGGPGHSPHVAAQVRLAPGERFVLDLSLEQGNYRLAGRELPFELDFRVVHGAPTTRWDLRLGGAAPTGLSRALAATGQRIEIENDTDVERVARIERRAPRDDVITAGRAATIPLFRSLFPQQLLSDGQLLTASQVTLLRVELQDVEELYDVASEAHVFAVLHRAFREVSAAAVKAGGALVKIDGDGAICSFPDAASAVRAAVALSRRLAVPRDLVVKSSIAIVTGRAMIMTLEDHLDYFGGVVRTLGELLRDAPPSSIAISDETASAAHLMDALPDGFFVLSGIQNDGSVVHVLQRQAPQRLSDEADLRDEITSPEGVPRSRGKS